MRHVDGQTCRVEVVSAVSGEEEHDVRTDVVKCRNVPTNLLRDPVDVLVAR